VKKANDVTETEATEILLASEDYQRALAAFIAKCSEKWTSKPDPEAGVEMGPDLTKLVVAAFNNSVWIRSRWEDAWTSNIGMTEKQLRAFPGLVSKIAKQIERLNEKSYFYPVHGSWIGDVPETLENYSLYLKDKISETGPFRRGRRVPLAQFLLNPTGVTLFSNYILGVTAKRYHREVADLFSAANHVFNPEMSPKSIGAQEIEKMVSKRNRSKEPLSLPIGGIEIPQPE
jgi:hypothetical protein